MAQSTRRPTPSLMGMLGGYMVRIGNTQLNRMGAVMVGNSTDGSDSVEIKCLGNDDTCPCMQGLRVIGVLRANGLVADPIQGDFSRVLVSWHQSG